MIRLTLKTILFIGIVHSISAQSRLFSDVANLKLNDSGVIMESDQVSGYYFFYSIGKAAKGEKNFILNILDENLQDVNTVTLREGKKSTLVESAFNGENIVIKLLDKRNLELSYLFFNTKGELIDRKTQKLDYSTVERDLKMEPVYDKGFIEYQKDQSERGFLLRYIPNVGVDGQAELNKYWSKKYNSSSKKGFAYCEALCTADNYMINLISDRKSSLRGDVSFTIQAVDLTTGNQVFRRGLNATYTSQPLKAYYDEETKLINVIGLFYSPEVKALKDNGLGLFNYQMNLEGKIVARKNLFWTREFRDFIEVDNEGRVTNDRRGFLYFHEIIRHSDGSFIAVSEQYQKVADAFGIAATALLGGRSSTSTTKIQVYDMAIFHFNSDFSIRNVVFIPKTKSNITLPSGYDFTNVHLLANYVNRIGGFDYLYTTQNEEEETTSITYLDYEKRSDEAQRQWVFHASTLYDGEFIEDKIEVGTLSESKNLRIFPGKPGNVVVSEYDKAQKSLRVYVEKINY